MAEQDTLIIYIGCLRFGGRRNSLACARFDRFRGCRKSCKTLEKAMKETEDFIDRVEKVYKDRKELIPAKHSCKGLPLQPYRCPLCDFAAQSERGLKSHKTRSHKEE